VVKVRIAAEEAPRFSVGSTWKVVSTSLESLWQGWYTIALEETETGAE